jgi:hypothetical protein
LIKADVPSFERLLKYFFTFFYHPLRFNYLRGDQAYILVGHLSKNGDASIFVLTQVSNKDAREVFILIGLNALLTYI